MTDTTVEQERITRRDLAEGRTDKVLTERTAMVSVDDVVGKGSTRADWDDVAPGHVAEDGMMEVPLGGFLVRGKGDSVVLIGTIRTFAEDVRREIHVRHLQLT